jgi:hypothetical protein
MVSSITNVNKVSNSVNYREFSIPCGALFTSDGKLYHEAARLSVIVYEKIKTASIASVPMAMMKRINMCRAVLRVRFDTCDDNDSRL